MNYRNLGKSELSISEISFGCMSLKVGEKDNQRILNKAVDNGINYFDTADLYDKGENEKLVGAALKNRRQQILIGSKVGNQWKADRSGWDWNPRKEYILKAVENSLSRLQTDYIDLYQLHGGTIDDPIDEVIEAFEKLVEQGKIRYYGISSIRPNVIRQYVSKSNIASVMMQYSMLDRRPEESCFKLLEENNIGVLARGGLAKGILVDKPAIQYLNYSESEVQNVKKAILESIKNEKYAEQIALQFVLNPTAVSSAVVGIRTLDQLNKALVAIKIPAPIDEIHYLQSIIPLNYYELHR
ncbi:aldo/keto reductase [Reichenbachiella sp. MALMAid0571]|uniref:aldo/keto reductase n=1 Tax=Reichenbachiella sp. MALMAid0571 TaxID=3143939 RepID=UPI0032DF481C